ncbi:hypothetical protein VT50_0200725 [Streptomyces antioxidans]|uniref:DUF3995 domain-containing protein n=2 Tax=Streptomyces TaxID=1883 RepID=A0A1V4DE47_9ACTN|nr:hypothetical protein VT50_0200725 [Streptomyces antioxidans]
MTTDQDLASPQPATGAAEPGPRPSRLVRWAAHAVPFTLLPTGLWRCAMGFGVPLGFATTSDLHESQFPSWMTVYVIALSLFAEGLGLLTLGLVRPWGEVVPRWIPFLGGKRIPVLCAVIPAGLGSLAVTFITIVGAFTWNAPENLAEISDPYGPFYWLQTACYAPLLAWGPLLAVVTVAYYRRRRAAERRPSASLPGRPDPR